MYKYIYNDIPYGNTKKVRVFRKKEDGCGNPVKNEKGGYYDIFSQATKEWCPLSEGEALMLINEFANNCKSEGEAYQIIIAGCFEEAKDIVVNYDEYGDPIIKKSF